MIRYVASFAVGFAVAAVIFSSIFTNASENARKEIWNEFKAREIPKAVKAAVEETRKEIPRAREEARAEFEETAVNAGFGYFEDKEGGKRVFRWLVCKDH